MMGDVRFSENVKEISLSYEKIFTPRLLPNPGEIYSQVLPYTSNKEVLPYASNKEEFRIEVFVFYQRETYYPIP
jgi:hypothetical protein